MKNLTQSKLISLLTILYILLVAGLGLRFYLDSHKKNTPAGSSYSQAYVDSLNAEIFVHSIQEQRYEYIFDRLEELNNPAVDSILNSAE